MRFRMIALALAVAACEPDAGDEQSIVPSEPIAVSFEGADARARAARAAHGERLSRVLGCRGCHGKQMEGKRFYELYASNLTRDLAGYSDKQLERLLREGVRPSQADVWGMPSELFQHLSEADMQALIVHLRTLKPTGGPTQPRLPWEPDAARMIAAGKIKPAADTVKQTRDLGPVDLGPTHALGRYITRVTCAECHGAELKGGDDTPDLIVAGGYSRAEFEKLMTQGIPTGGRKFKNQLMADVAQSRFSQFTRHERDALYAYLKARAEQPQ